MSEAIIGNYVKFVFSCGETLSGTLVSIPKVSGEHWIMREYHEGTPLNFVYVNNYDYMKIFRREGE